MIWERNKWKRADVLDAATAVYLENLRNQKIVQIVFKLTSDGYEKAIGHSSVVSEGFCAVESLGGMKEETNYEKSSLQKGDLLIKDEVCKEGNYGKSSPCKAVCAIEGLGGIKEELLMKDEICKEGNCQKSSLYNEMDSNTYLLKQDTVAKGNKKVLPAYKKLKASSLRRRLLYLPYIEPVVWQGKFSVPLSALTGKSAIDDKNLVLVEAYTRISGCLQSLCEVMMMPGIVEVGYKTIVKKMVSRIRSACLVLRREIRELGGVPVGEPVSYWRFKYPQASF